MKQTATGTGSSSTQNEWVRPHSASPALLPSPPPDDVPRARMRPKSSKFRTRPEPAGGAGDDAAGGLLSPAWAEVGGEGEGRGGEGEEGGVEDTRSTKSSSSAEIGTQTGGELLKDYDPVSRRPECFRILLSIEVSSGY